MEYPINAEPPEHRAARQRTDEEDAALWFTKAEETENRKDDES